MIRVHSTYDGNGYVISRINDITRQRERYLLVSKVELDQLRKRLMQIERDE